jgi:hypothetical protein
MDSEEPKDSLRALLLAQAEAQAKEATGIGAAAESASCAADRERAQRVRSEIWPLPTVPVACVVHTRGRSDTGWARALQAELQSLRLGALERRARLGGVGAESVGAALDADDAATALMELIVEAELAPPEPQPEAQLGQGQLHQVSSAPRNDPRRPLRLTICARSLGPRAKSPGLQVSRAQRW